ncbi:MAG: bifunctional folylpolyglutamate synthase/dihydrofolate synthase [Akkermansiaceae bacterium]|nr:bifunctional folylpolyglutamate synthase/dihydrofolate synthase [Armatimonadota bacterium]
MTTDSPLNDVIAYFATLREFAPRTDRDCFRALLSRLGDPHEKLRCLHVAGTNGKGSTVTFLASALRAAGYRVGAYLSPFVWDVRERWQINNELIPPDELIAQVDAIRPHVESLAEAEYGQITEFELKTAVAFRWFAQERVDFAVVEVGIGGRLDSTNVIPAPLVSVITSIGWDHQHLLGDTLEAIAGEKAGIIKRGSVACVTAVREAEPLRVIREKARNEGVPLTAIGAAEADEIRSFDLSLHGEFQLHNAACAAAALRILHKSGNITVSEAALRHGLKRATLPGRFEVIRSLSEPDGTPYPPIVLDVAHNVDAARVLAQALAKEFGTGKNATLVIGMSKSHDAVPFLSELAPLARRVIATAPRFRPKPASEIADAARSLGLPVTRTKSVEDALKVATNLALQENDASSYVVVTGSFYTIGETSLQ